MLPFFPFLIWFFWIHQPVSCTWRILLRTGRQFSLGVLTRRTIFRLIWDIFGTFYPVCLVWTLVAGIRPLFLLLFRWNRRFFLKEFFCWISLLFKLLDFPNLPRIPLPRFKYPQNENFESIHIYGILHNLHYRHDILIIYCSLSKGRIPHSLFYNLNFFIILNCSKQFKKINIYI